MKNVHFTGWSWKQFQNIQMLLWFRWTKRKIIKLRNNHRTKKEHKDKTPILEASHFLEPLLLFIPRQRLQNTTTVIGTRSFLHVWSCPQRRGSISYRPVHVLPGFPPSPRETSCRTYNYTNIRGNKTQHPRAPRFRNCRMMTMALDRKRTLLYIPRHKDAMTAL